MKCATTRASDLHSASLEKSRFQTFRQLLNGWVIMANLEPLDGAF